MTGEGPRTGKTLLLVVLMLGMAWTPFFGANEEVVLEVDNEPRETVLHLQNFTTQQGFTLTNLSFDAASGLTTLNRPSVSWSATTGLGLSIMRTGACSAYLPSTNEVFLIGGRMDANPTQTGDEAPTKMVEIFDVTNNSWSPAFEDLKSTQQYHGCAVAGNKIYAIGDHYPFATPAQQATGLVQVYDPAQGNWSYGTSMPANKAVGLAGITSLGGMIYVAGGVTAADRSDMNDRLMRYDPVNDTWTQMASMNNKRHSFDLVAFRGKLIAYGGVATFFDPVANTTVQKETNLTEAYDPATNTWSQLPNATYALSAYAAEVYNDEIIVHGGYELTGWSGTANDKTYGYDPFTNRWSTRATLQIGMFDSTLTRANNTLVYATGDSSYTRFNTWSVQYLAETEYHVNPASQAGLLTSSIQDMRSHTQGAASLLWFAFDTVEPAGSSIGVQYRTAQSQQAMASASWKPTSVPINTYLSAGNTSLTDALEDAPYIQYRARYTTTDIMAWNTPTLLTVNIGADSAAFVSSVPTSLQPTSTPITLTTHHHATTQSGTYTLQLHPSDNVGGLLFGQTWTQLVWNTTTSSLSVLDNAGLLFGQPTATVTSGTASGHSVDWSFSLGGTMPSSHLRIKTTTHAERNATYTHPGAVGIDRSVTVEMTGITADASSQGNATLETGEVIPGNTELNVTLDHFFTNSGLRLLGGNIEARLHLDMETYDEDAFGQRIWSNESSEWFRLNPGQLQYAHLNVPETLSGEVGLWMEARTNEDWSLTFSTDAHDFIVNARAPLLQSVTPSLDAYVNEDSSQPVSFAFYDLGGFTNETLFAYTWLEGLNDGTGGGSMDGVAQRSEYTPAAYSLAQDGNLWYVNLSVNDTINNDHEGARVLLEGGDLAGYSVPQASAQNGHARWESRTPAKSTLVSFTPTKNLLTDTLMRFEPSQEVGWTIVVADDNGLQDLIDVRLELGNDERLGFIYTVVDNTCSALDERLQLLPTGCEVNTANGELRIDVTATVEWSLTEAGLIDGEVDLSIRDLDGLQRYDFSEAWVLERSMSIDLNRLMDNDGVVTQTVDEGAVVMAGDRLNLSAEVRHLTSGTPYTGDLRLRWDGTVQGADWRGGVPVTLINGALTASIPTPEESGLVQDLTVTLWDPLQTEVLATLEVGTFQIDNIAPALLPSTLSNSISRYHLDAVQVGVNIDEPEGWSSPLSVTCQIRSLAVEWTPITLERNATTVFNGNTMFSFTYDFSDLGDPSTLSPQATLACWAEGLDDAGWPLVSETGNSELDPWLEASLNNIGPDLALENIEITGGEKAGEKVSLSFLVLNAGEGLTTPFNASIELIQGDERTLVGRSIFNSMDENTAKSVRRSFTAPEGKWTIEITVDLEQNIWEIDETNNVYSASFTSNAGGLGALAVAGGVGGLALLGAAVLLRRRASTDVDEKALAAAMNNEPTPTPAPASAAGTPTPKKGPPGGKIATGPASRPPKGPPKSPPKGPPTASEPENESPQAMAAKYMDALGVPEAQPEAEPTTVGDYSQLPGGGEYEYTAEGTFYVGEACGRWVLNEDKSFTKLTE
jgi:N-acetylneuraminic acid mutarotase